MTYKLWIDAEPVLANNLTNIEKVVIVGMVTFPPSVGLVVEFFTKPGYLFIKFETVTYRPGENLFAVKGTIGPEPPTINRIQEIVQTIGLHVHEM